MNKLKCANIKVPSIQSSKGDNGGKGNKFSNKIGKQPDCFPLAKAREEYRAHIGQAFFPGHAAFWNKNKKSTSDKLQGHCFMR